MTAKTKTLTVRGHKIRSASMRRFVVVAARETAYVDEGGTYAAFARIERRSDSAATAQTAARRMRDQGYRGRGIVVVVVDTVTGEEI